jgi:hypothetical protein
VAEDLPTTIEAAIRLLLAMVPDSEQGKIASMAEDDLVSLHFGLGTWIRNHLGMWRGNPELLAATGKQDPDEASGAIIQALWQRLRDEFPKLALTRGVAEIAR